MLEKVALAINTKNPRIDWLQQVIDSAKGFNEMVIYADGKSDLKGLMLPEGMRIEQDFIDRSEPEGFNHAVSKTNCEWVCHFCDDDFFIPGSVEQLNWLVNTGNFRDADVIFFRCAVDGSPWGADTVSLGAICASNNIPYASYVRKSVWDEVGGYKTPIWGDWNLWIRLLKAGKRFVYHPEVIFNFRSDGSGYSGRKIAELGRDECVRLVMDTN